MYIQKVIQNAVQILVEDVMGDFKKRREVLVTGLKLERMVEEKNVALFGQYANITNIPRKLNVKIQNVNAVGVAL